MTDVYFLQRVILALAPFALADSGSNGDAVPLQYLGADGQMYCVLIGDGEDGGQYLTTSHLKAAARVMGLIPEEQKS